MKKQIYLTIDDAPSKDFIEKIDFLEKNKIKAIIFCEGKFLEENKNKVAEAIKKGFIIGNHSYNHLHFSKLSLEQAKKEIEKTDALIEEIYYISNKKRKIKLFRFPYGDKGGKNKERIQKILKSLEYKQPNFKIKHPWFKENNLDKDLDIFWTLDYEEWGRKTTIDIINKRMLDKNPKTGGNLFDLTTPEIFLIHDHQETKEKFFFIINKLIAMNVEFISI